MIPSFSRFARIGRPLTARERRIVGLGAVTALFIVVAVQVVIPTAGRWQRRENAIATKAVELARLQALVAESTALDRRVKGLRSARRTRESSLLQGGTFALAGSTLQSLIRGYGEQSRVLIQRLDAVRPVASNPAAPDADGVAAVDTSMTADLVPVGLILSGRGDIYGLVDLLDRLRNGETLLVVDELRVNGPLGSSSENLLTWTVRVTGYFSPGERGT